VALVDLLTGKAALWAAGAALAASLAFGTMQTLRLASARTALASEQRDRAAERMQMEQAAREQAERFRATEHDWQEAQRENSILARKARELAALDAAAAGAAGGRLHDRAAALAAACRGPARNPAAVAGGPAASAPGDVLANMLGRLDEAGRIVARYADSASISGEQCAADYQALRKGRAEAVDRAWGR
jgi:predicted phage gp36 major capsid-like protein